MRVFLLPIVIVSDKNDAELLLYTVPEYIAWKEKSRDKATEYKIKKYYQVCFMKILYSNYTYMVVFCNF